MKKLSRITEGILGDIAKRDMSGEKKKEDGRKVKTCLGIDIFLENPECDYNQYIIETLEGTSYTDYDIIEEQELKTTDYKSIDAIKKDEHDYAYIIHEGYGHTGLVVTFSSYEDILDFVLDDMFKNEYSEHDYKQICGCIAQKFKELGDYIECVPQRNVGSLNDCNNLSKYRGHFMLKLIDETDVSHWYYENYETIDEDHNINTFYEDFIHTFDDMRYEDIITWSYGHEGNSIGIPINCNNMINFEKYREYTKKWFDI